MSDSKITVSLQKKELRLSLSSGTIHTFPVAIGKPETPTPKGHWLIQNKKILPDQEVFGAYWLGLSIPGYGIHGTNQPSSIGKAVSGGCIRMHNRDIQYLFEHVTIGTPVIIAD